MKPKLLLSGPNSMLGRALIPLLQNYDVVQCPHLPYDFTSEKNTMEAFSQIRPNFVITLAGLSGGLPTNLKYPADIFLTNTQMACNILSSAQKYKVEKLVYMLPTCAYSNQDILEAYDTDKPPHYTVACHGLSRRNYLHLSKFLNAQYDFQSVGCSTNTIYGPWDRYGEKAKVMGAMIKKFLEAKKNSTPVQLFGTGEPRRGFIYVKDAAKAIVSVLESYRDINAPACIDSHEISIKELAKMIGRLINYKGEIIWDTQKPDGQLRKQLLTNFPYKLTYSLEKGIVETIEAYNRGERR